MSGPEVLDYSPPGVFFPLVVTQSGCLTWRIRRRIISNRVQRTFELKQLFADPHYGSRFGEDSRPRRYPSKLHSCSTGNLLWVKFIHTKLLPMVLFFTRKHIFIYIYIYTTFVLNMKVECELLERPFSTGKNEISYLRERLQWRKWMICILMIFYVQLSMSLVFWLAIRWLDDCSGRFWKVAVQRLRASTFMRPISSLFFCMSVYDMTCRGSLLAVFLLLGESLPLAVVFFSLFHSQSLSDSSAWLPWPLTATTLAARFIPAVPSDASIEATLPWPHELCVKSRRKKLREKKLISLDR